MAVAAPELGQIRPPELEVYGRSLSTIYRLGQFMVERTVEETISSPEAAQARAEFYTSVEEGFGTDPELGGGLEVRDFDTRPIMDGRVMSKDQKTAIADMTEAGLACAKDTLKNDPQFLPQWVRSKWDHKNALIVDEMARGETPYNTRIVVSPFPEEAAERSGDDYWRNIGYVPHLRRGFVQVYHVGENGVVAGSLSFDGSDKARLREVFKKCGIEIPETEITDNWLQYAVTASLNEEDAKELALDIANELADPKFAKSTNTVDVTDEHRVLMDKVFNDSYIHACESFRLGRQTTATQTLIRQLAHRADRFNNRYSQSLYGMRSNKERFDEDDMAVIHEMLVYSTIEMMRKLHISTQDLSDKNSNFYRNGTYNNPVSLKELSVETFQQALSDFAAEGARNNRVYSACGLAISLGDETRMSADGASGPQTAYGGNLTREQLSWHGGKIKKGKCVSCKKNTNVGVKSWCKSCIKC